MATKYLSEKTVTLTGTTTPEIDLGESGLLEGIQMPSSWTAADIKFTVSSTSGGTFQALYDAEGTEQTVTTAASRYVALNAAITAGMRYIKVISSASQASARTLILHIKYEV